MLPSLKELDLGAAFDAALAELTDFPFPSVETLKLRDARLPSFGRNTVSNLTSLHLFDTVTPLMAISAPVLPNLKRLTIWNSCFDEQTVKCVEALAIASLDVLSLDIGAEGGLVTPDRDRDPAIIIERMLHGFRGQLVGFGLSGCLSATLIDASLLQYLGTVKTLTLGGLFAGGLSLLLGRLHASMPLLEHLFIFYEIQLPAWDMLTAFQQLATPSEYSSWNEIISQTTRYTIKLSAEDISYWFRAHRWETFLSLQFSDSSSSRRKSMTSASSIWTGSQAASPGAAGTLNSC